MAPSPGFGLKGGKMLAPDIHTAASSVPTILAVRRERLRISAPRPTQCWCSPTSWCSARLACVFAAPGLARNGIRLGRPPLQRSSGLVVLELLPTESLGRVLALPAALRQGALRGQLPGGDAWRCGADGRAAADDSLLHRRPSGYPLSRLARLEMGARRSPCSTVHRLRRRVCAPQDTEMLPASNFVCEFGECVRPTSPLLGACGNCLLACFQLVA